MPNVTPEHLQMLLFHKGPMAVTSVTTITTFTTAPTVSTVTTVITVNNFTTVMTQ